jgi:uncharacterized protein YciI
MIVYAVIRVRGNTWQEGLNLEAQVDWDAHASFMDALVDDGFVVLGGPLEGTDEVLLIVRAGSSDEISDRLRLDPWTMNGLLNTVRILPWSLRLGSLPL